MELASLVRKANILKGKYKRTDRITVSGGCTCPLDHSAWTIRKIPGKILYLPSEDGLERAQGHALGNLGHSSALI